MQGNFKCVASKINIKIHKKGAMRIETVMAPFYQLKIYQPVSRILYPDKSEWLSFIWLQHYCYNLAAYPSAQLLAQL